MAKLILSTERYGVLVLVYQHSAGRVGVGIRSNTNIIEFRPETLEKRLAREKVERNARRREARRRKRAATEQVKARRQA
jgi:hypothetical protein